MDNSYLELGEKIGNKIGLINMSREVFCSLAKIKEGSFTSVTGCTFGEFVDELLHRKVKIGKMRKNGPYVHKIPNTNLSKAWLLELSMPIAKKKGYKYIKRHDIANAANISVAAVSYVFGDSKKLADALVEYAIHINQEHVVAQAINNNHPLTKNITKALRNRAQSIKRPITTPTATEKKAAALREGVAKAIKSPRSPTISEIAEQSGLSYHQVYYMQKTKGKK